MQHSKFRKWITLWKEKINGWINKQIRDMWIYTDMKRQCVNVCDVFVNVAAVEGKGRVKTKPQEYSRKSKNR